MLARTPRCRWPRRRRQGMVASQSWEGSCLADSGLRSLLSCWRLQGPRTGSSLCTTRKVVQSTRCRKSRRLLTRSRQLKRPTWQPRSHTPLGQEQCCLGKATKSAGEPSSLTSSRSVVVGRPRWAEMAAERRTEYTDTAPGHLRQERAKEAASHAVRKDFALAPGA